MDIRKQTGIIIKREGMYLVGRIIYSTELRWSRSPWDAWITRDRGKAERVAGKVGGTKMLFNPVAGQIRRMELL